MKLSKVAKLCKDNSSITIINALSENGHELTQWVGTPYALYPFYNLPIMNEQTAYVMFDVDEKKRVDMTYSETDAAGSPMNLDEDDPTERSIEPQGVNIVYGSRVYIPFDTSKGIRLINRAYLAPMQSKLDLITFSERQTADGSLYIVARLGLFIAGVIAPYTNGEDKDLAKFAKVFYERMEYAHDCARAEATRRAKKEIVLVNGATGEIMSEAGEENADE